MKYYFLFFIISNCLNAQILQGFVNDSVNKKNLPLSNIVYLKSNFGVYSDNRGFYKIDLSNHTSDTLKVSCIGYEELLMPLDKFKEKINNFNFYLVEKVIKIDEIKIETKKRSYTEKHTLGEKRNGNVAMFSLIGFENACLIENPYNKKGKLKSIKLDLKKNKDANFTAKFNLKIYQYDTINRSPGSVILNKNLIISPKNKNYKLKINMTDYNITFPKRGICIGIEYVDPENLAKKWDKIGPGLRFTYAESKQLTWCNYRNRGWFGNDLKSASKKGNLIIGIDVLLDKNEKNILLFDN